MGGVPNGLMIILELQLALPINIPGRPIIQTA